MKYIKKYFGTVILMLVGAVCGVMTIFELESMTAFELPFPQYMLTLIGMIFVMCAAFYLHIIIHEAGHLVFGLLTGYSFSSFRIGSLMLIKQDGKIRLKRFSLAGTGGQCLLLPPDMKDGKIPYVLYNLGGSFANFFAAIVFLPLIFILDSGVLHFFAALMIAVGIGYAVLNGVPMNVSGVANDGFNAKSLGKNPNSLRAFYIQMKVNEGQASGVRLKDMPNEWFDVPNVDDMKNVICSTLAVMRTSRNMDKHDFKEAGREIDALLLASKNSEAEILQIYISMMSCDRIFCELIGDGNRDKVSELLTKDVKAVMKQMKSMLTVIRTEYVLALLYDNNTAEAKRLEDFFEKQALKYPHPAEVEAEREIIKLAKAKINVTEN